jgi:hypothetical protein
MLIVSSSWLPGIPGALSALHTAGYSNQLICDEKDVDTLGFYR